MLYKFTLILMTVFIAMSALADVDELDSMKIDLAPDQPHQFIFTNKKAAFWFGETQRPNQGGFQGYTILEQRYLLDYMLVVDGAVLDRSSAEKIELYPDRLVRRYPQLTETLHFVDSLNLVLIDLQPVRPLKVAAHFHFAEPIMQNAWTWNEKQNSNETRFYGFGLDKPVFLACKVAGDAEATESQILDSKEKMGNFPGGVGFKMEIQGPVTLAAIFAQTQPELERIYALMSQKERLLEIRRNRIRALLKNAGTETGNPELDLAYRWALISMDDLVTEQRGKGIWAGLPWFNNYWGRDSFISFTGALLCTGQFEEARQILLSFSEFQNQDISSPFYGRIPNRVMLKEIIYNTADGTPWFVRACENYVKYSGDSRFIEQIFPVVQRAMDGALRYHVDDKGFLTHGDAETWMDAVGTEGPWSPRGNRAVEIQALWLEQMRISIDWARRLGFDDLAKKWAGVQELCRSNFTKFFWNGEQNVLYDHLNDDGSPDTKLRPNQIFALTFPKTPLLNQSREEKVLAAVTDKLTYPWGVGSLWQGDPDFHPYHHYPPYYAPDAAYHNGIVWTWLAGPLLTALFPCNPGLAFRVLQDEADQILNTDASGSYSELLEAWPRKGHEFPQMSGTVSQAWNLAEFIRNVQQDLLGISPDVPRDSLVLQPHLPPDLKNINFTFRYGSHRVEGSYRIDNEDFLINLKTAAGRAKSVHLFVSLPASEEKTAQFRTDWNMGLPLEIRMNREGEKVLVRASGKDITEVKQKNRRILADLSFCQPTMNMNLPVFKGPGFDLIAPEDAIQRPGKLTRVVLSAADAEFDDKGPNGKYVYPTNPAFAPGIFDGRAVKIWSDENYYYFKVEYRNLVNPGWRPESGFQLTYTAIALNFGDKAGFRRTRVEMNANFTIPFEYAYNRIIFVGNGFRITDARDQIIAEYRPQDSEHPIGFANDHCIRFSVPRKYLPSSGLKNAFVLIGGQDDHGAGGIGEFRTVGQKASEWQGGGGEQPQGNPSVYDVIEVR